MESTTSQDVETVAAKKPVLVAANSTITRQLPIISVAPKFLRWLENIDTHAMNIENILVKDVVWFGQPSPKTLGFLLLDIDAYAGGGRKLPSVVFLRGPSVAVQVSVICGGETYIVITKQVRAATGSVRHEIPAGMVDAEQNISGVVIKELQEETGITIGKADTLTDLGSFWPSPGACDEEIHLYACQTEMSREKMDELQAKVHGVGEDEAIRIEFVPLKSYSARLWKMGDAKAEVAFRRWSEMED